MTSGCLQPSLQQCQLWAQSRLLRALSNYVLKTCKDRDGTTLLMEQVLHPDHLTGSVNSF